MQKPAVVLGFLLLVAPIFAQPDAPVHTVFIKDIGITGVSHVSSTDLQSIQDEITQQCCVFAETQEIRERISYAFQERGYFKAHINRLDVTPLALQTIPPAVAVSVDVSDGQQFQLKSITFNGAKEFASEQLRQQFAISDGDVLNTEKIRKGLDDLRKLYASHGYINFTPVPNTAADDNTATISLSIDVDEGRQFHLGGLVLDGVEPHVGDGAKLLDAWKPIEGEVYGGSEFEQWWKLALIMLPPGSTMERSLELKQDPAAGMVTALLKFPD